MILQGVINKFGAVFIMIPDPVVGGLFCVMFGMITAFGLSALQYVDLRSSRNLYIIGISLFFPLVLCQWMQEHPGVINTGIEELDSTLTVLLSTTILVGGCLGCLLDNLIPGKQTASEPFFRRDSKSEFIDIRHKRGTRFNCMGEGNVIKAK